MTRKRKRRKAQKEELVSYFVKVADWHYSYSFRGGDPKSRWDEGRYNELATLSFTGDLIQPKDSRHKNAEVTLSARTHMMDEPVGDKPASIGSLSASGNDLSAYIFVPVERLSELTAVAQSARVQTIHIVGSKLRYRSGTISSMSLDTHYDEEDW